MANAWAASLPAVGANNGGNVTLTFSNFVNAAGGAYTLVQGDVVVVAYAASGTADLAMAATWSGGVGDSTKLGEHYSNGTIDTNLGVFAKTMGASPDASVTVTGPTGNSNATIAVAHVIKGADISSLDVAAVTAAGTGTSVPNPGQVIPATAGAFIAVAGAGAAAAGATFTNSDLSSTTNHWRTGNHAETNDIAIGFGWKENWVSGAFDPAVWGGGNVNASNSWAALTLALRPLPAVANAEPDDATHGHAGDASTAVPHAVAAPADVTHAQAADAAAPIAHAVASPADASHAQSAEASTCTPHGPPAQAEPADADHGHAADASTVTAKAVASPVDAAHAHSVDAGSAVAHAVAGPTDAVHGQSAEAPTVTARFYALPGDSAHGHGSDIPTISAHAIASPADCGHGQSADQPSAAATFNATPADATHGQAADEPAIIASAIAAPTDTGHAHGAESPTAAGSNPGGAEPADAGHALRSEAPAIAASAPVVPNDAAHAQSADAAAAQVPGISTTPPWRGCEPYRWPRAVEGDPRDERNAAPARPARTAAPNLQQRGAGG